MYKILLTVILVLFMGCANLHIDGGIVNPGTMITDSNFKYIGKVRGEAKEQVFFGLAMGDGDLYIRAMSDIYNKVDFYDGAKKGLINMTYDDRYKAYFFFPFVDIFFIGERTLTITADVVEFYDVE